MRRVVVDTNVLVAGLITADAQSPTARVVDEMLNGRVLFLLSPALLAEYRSVLLRPKLVALHALNAVEVDQLLTEVTLNALWREPFADGDAPDPGDNHLWALLDHEPQAMLVTGDRRLIDEPHDKAMVVSPAMLREVQGGHRYTITSRGVPVAALVPINTDDEVARREAVAAMRALPQVVGVPDAELQDWISEGRR